MSVTTIILLSILTILILILIGYGTWSWAESSYDYNIFNWGIILRGFIGAICLIIGGVLCTQSGEFINYSDMVFDTGTVILLLVGVGLFLWNFISTLINTNFVIAILSFIYQIILIYFVFQIVNRMLTVIKGEY